MERERIAADIAARIFIAMIGAGDLSSHVVGENAQEEHDTALARRAGRMALAILEEVGLRDLPEQESVLSDLDQIDQ